MKNLGRIILGCLLLLVCGFAFPAFAHKVIISAYAEGDVIEGEIGFSNGDVAKDTVVEVLDDEGNKIGEAKTDEEGIFQYKPAKRIALNFRSNLGSGHVAFYRMAVEDLPDNIGGKDINGLASVPELEKPILTSEEDKAVGVGVVASGVDPEALKEMIEVAVNDQVKQLKPIIATAVRKETKPLRQVLASYMEKNDMQAILGGIGYIAGLCGVGFYVAARMERRKVAASEKSEAA